MKFNAGDKITIKGRSIAIGLINRVTNRISDSGPFPLIIEFTIFGDKYTMRTIEFSKKFDTIPPVKSNQEWADIWEKGAT